MASKTVERRVIEAATRAVERVPVEVVIRRYPDRVDDEETGHVALGDPVDEPWVTSPRVEFEQRFVDGETILEGDALAVIPVERADGSGLSAAMKEGDEIVYPDGTWRVMRVRTHSGGTAAAAYECRIREA